MIRQYVGARYVPKFADPVAWTHGTSYEAMTIVTYNNSSYTSKIPVPATVGNPADNPDYWALTGNYNAQVESYRTEVETVKTGLANETSAREEEVETVKTGLANETSARENADAALHKQVDKYYLFIGDSYAVESVTGTNRWPVSLAKLLKLNGDQYTISSQGSTGFIGITTNTWLDLLKNANVTNKESVTDIIVAGGANDSGVSDPSSLVPAISEFMTEAKKLYPNAKVYLANIMYAKNMRTRYMSLAVVDRYYPAIENYGGIYLPNTWKCILNPALLQDDGIHPIYNGIANERIAQAIYNAINGTYYPVPILRNLNLTNSDIVTELTDIRVTEYCQNESIGWYVEGLANTIPQSFYVGFNKEVNIANMIKIASIDTALPSPGGALNCTPCAIIPRTTGPTHIAISGRLIMSSGDLYVSTDPQSTPAEFTPAINCTAMNVIPYTYIPLFD